MKSQTTAPLAMCGWSHQLPQSSFTRVAGRVVAYQPGRMIEMTFAGMPYIWGVRTLTPETVPAQSLAA